MLALLAAPGTTSRAVPLLGLIGLPRPGGVLAPAGRAWCPMPCWSPRSTRSPALRRGAAGPRRRCGSSTTSTSTWPSEAGATLLLTARPELVARGALLVPPIGIEVDRWPAIAPLVRRRRREQLGLPERSTSSRSGRARTRPTASCELAVASAAVVSGPATLLALALGTPTVTSGDTARRLGLRPGRDVEVATGPDAALELAAGDRRRRGPGRGALAPGPAVSPSTTSTWAGRRRPWRQRLGPGGHAARARWPGSTSGWPSWPPRPVRRRGPGWPDALAALTADGGGSSA